MDLGHGYSMNFLVVHGSAAQVRVTALATTPSPRPADRATWFPAGSALPS